MNPVSRNSTSIDEVIPISKVHQVDIPSASRTPSAQALPLNLPCQDLLDGLTMEDRDASTSTLIIDRITDVNQTPYYMNDENIGFLLDCAKRGQNLGKQPPPSICKVSRIHRDLSECSFSPQLVSIGPIHREDLKLQEFERQKERYLNDLLDRCNSTPKKTLEACLLKVNTLIPQVRESYAGMIQDYSDVEVARMMVMDGCFILEFCFKHVEEDEYLPNKMQNSCIAMDLILLENQVPFFVLEALFDCSMGKTVVLPNKMQNTLSDLLDAYLAPYFKLFGSVLPEKSSTTNVHSVSTTNVNSDSTPAHVLGYLHKRYQLVAPKSSEKAALHSIVELDRSGMNFKPHQEDEWSMTIKFQSSHFACLPRFRSKPTLLMPTLLIEDTTELILRNLIAYEQSFLQDRYYFTSYATAMDNLIDTQEDIAKLVESKVLVNMLGSNQEAADMINKLCKNIIIADFYYNQEFKQVDKYYNGFWPKHIAKLRRVYFSNPWSAIALFAAIILFILTVVQTVYTIRGT